MNTSSKLCAALLILSLTACGKYGPPVPPERLAPKPVGELVVKGATEGVKLSWNSPDKDLRGNELRSLDGYKLYRAKVDAGANIDASNFELLTSVEDRSMAELKKKQEQAIAEGKSARGAKVDGSLKHFEYLDSAVKSGETYLYRVVPINQEGGEGSTRQLVRVIFKGDLSEIAMIPDSLQEDVQNDLF